MSTPPPEPEAETAGGWIARLAAELDVEPLSPRTQAAVLGLAREVAHGTERKAAPLVSFLAGRFVQDAVDAGGDADEALRIVSEAVDRLLGR
ncbi:MAG: hypothetical protein JOZ75_05940 [Candidatus Dormibacteraeota bacterium]|nr:hypothetical protein [Candidatus Dormibacteraeota bacterium]